MVGRFRDGTPLALFDQPMLENGKATRAQIRQIRKFNNYKLSDNEAIDYRADRQGLRCPFHAHVRKANPRDRELIRKKGEKYLLNEKEVAFDIRIARRGIPYRETDRAGHEKTGLLFMCYQASIDTQYMIIQREWCNGIRFPAPTAGTDPLIGRKKGFSPDSEYRWIQTPGHTVTEPLSMNFQDLITLRGGDFFYVPSINWLKKL
jgi:deferrochelatase/peroxidase EfeB